MGGKWVWEQGLKVKMMKLNKKGCLLSQVITSRKDARPGTNSARTCSPSTSNAMLLCSVGGKEQGANREFIHGGRGVRRGCGHGPDYAGRQS